MARTSQDADPRHDDAALVALFAGHGIDRDSAAHFRGRLDRRLLLHRCDDCGHWHHPPRPMCPRCWGWNITPTEVSGTGVVHLRMDLFQGPPAPGVDYTAGHPVVTVELDDQPGLRFTATLVPGPDSATIGIGSRVTLDWIDRGGVPTPAFRAAS